MGYERYPRGTNPQGDYYGREDPQDYGHDYGSGRDYSYSSARDYAAVRGERERNEGGRDRGGYGGRDYGNQRYGQRDTHGGVRSYGSAYGGDFGRTGGQRGDRDRYIGGYADRGGSPEYHGSYASDGRRFEDVGRYRDADDDDRDRQAGRSGQRQEYGRPSYGARPQGYSYDDRGFFQRAGDEVRSWFGDDEAERRREQDQRYDERADRDQARGSGHRDSDYHSWRSGQIAALDRDYDEYRQENRSRFENEFSSWRTSRQGQRDQLGRVKEHMDVVGSDGEHVGTVDKVRGDRVILTKNDADAGGRHHSFASNWVASVDDRVTLSKTAADAKKQWQDEDRNQAMFGHGDNDRSRDRDRTGSTAQASSTAKTY